MTESQPQEIFDSPEVVPVLGEPVPLGRNLGDELALSQYRHPEWTPNRPDAAQAPYAPYFFDLQPGDIFWWPCTPDRGAGRTWHTVLIVRRSRDDEFERCYTVRWLRHPDPDAFPVTWEVCRSAVAFPLTHQERNAVRSDPSLRCLARHHLCAVLTNYHLARVAPAEAHILPECLAPHTFQPLLRYIHLLPERCHAGGPFRTPPDEWRQHSPGGTWISPASPGSVDFDAGRPGRTDHKAVAEADISTSSSAPSPATHRAGAASGPAPPSPHPSSTPSSNSPRRLARQVPGGGGRGDSGAGDGAGAVGSAALADAGGVEDQPSRGSPMLSDGDGSASPAVPYEPVQDDYDAEHNAFEVAPGPMWWREDSRGGQCLASGGQADVSDGGQDPRVGASRRDSLPWWHPDRVKRPTPAQPASSSWLSTSRLASPQAGGVSAEASDRDPWCGACASRGSATAVPAVHAPPSQPLPTPWARHVRFASPTGEAGAPGAPATGRSLFPSPAVRARGPGAAQGGGGAGSCLDGSHGPETGARGPAEGTSTACCWTSGDGSSPESDGFRAPMPQFDSAEEEGDSSCGEGEGEGSPVLALPRCERLLARE